jgi:HSP20 family protein
MTIIRRHRTGNLSDMFQNLFDADFNDVFSRRLSDPAANILESPESFQLELAAPGMNKEDFKIHLENNILTISAEMEDEKREDGKNYTRKEFYYGSFSRSFTLPKIIDFEKIKADYENGVLKVLLPKKEEAKLELKKEIKIS